MFSFALPLKDAMIYTLTKFGVFFLKTCILQAGSYYLECHIFYFSCIVHHIFKVKKDNSF